MKNPKYANKPFGERLRQPLSGATYPRAGDIVERLFGHLTQLPFIVELGAKGCRERHRLRGKKPRIDRCGPSPAA